MNRQYLRKLILFIACFCLSLNFHVYAKEAVPEEPVYEAGEDVFVYVSPLSRKSVTDADLQRLQSQEADSEPAVYSTLEEAVTGVREACKKRDLPISCRLDFETDLSNAELFDLIAEHNGVPDEGDVPVQNCRFTGCDKS